MKQRFTDVKEYIQKHSGQFIADIGIGNGYYWQYEDPTNVIGVDLSQRNLDKLAGHSPGIKTYIADARDTKLPSKTYDLVIISQTIEHIDDYHLVLAEAKRIVKDDGYFFIGVPTEDHHKLHFYPIWTLDDVINLSKSLGDLIELKKESEYWHLYIKNK